MVTMMVVADGEAAVVTGAAGGSADGVEGDSADDDKSSLKTLLTLLFSVDGCELLTDAREHCPLPITL
jgi:hypothetical protein